MSQMSDRAQKPYPEDLITPEELPDEAPVEHPTPWSETEAGNGHFYLWDVNGVKIAHVYVYDERDAGVYCEKIAKINGLDPAVLRADKEFDPNLCDCAACHLNFDGAAKPVHDGACCEICPRCKLRIKLHAFETHVKACPGRCLR